MKIAAGADHAGYQLKERLIRTLRGQGHEVRDLGTLSAESVDYPDYAAAVAGAVADGSVTEGGAERGLLVCGTGIGVAIAANKVHGIRAATCNDLFTARMARAHNDANVLALGARVVGVGLAKEIIRAFFSTEWEGARHARRVDAGRTPRCEPGIVGPAHGT